MARRYMMKKTIMLVLIMSLAAFLLFTAGGCSKVGERIAESISEEAIESAIEEGIEGEGGQAEVDISEGEVSITTEEGETSWGLSTELPENFPNVVPLYPNMTPKSTMTWTEDGKDFFIIEFETNDTGEEIYNWYMDKFPAEGWTIDFSSTNTSDGDKYYNVTANDGTYVVVIMISVYEGETSVSLDVGYKE
jgi:hypothetical protein